MANNDTITRLYKKAAYYFLILLISMAGYVPKNATILRTITMVSSLAFAIYIGNYQTYNFNLAVLYYILGEIGYVGFITIVLSKNGLRHWFVEKWGNENEGYLAFEAILGFLFFHNVVSIGYVASSSPGNLFPLISSDLLLIAAIMFIVGFTIKIWATEVVTIEIYYWKDMFLGRKISDFAVSEPYQIAVA